MNWPELIEQLLTDFRTSSYDLQKKYLINSATISNIRRGKSAPSNKIIRDLETALKIKINNSDPNNLSYTVNPSIGNNLPTIGIDLGTTQSTIKYKDIEENMLGKKDINPVIRTAPGYWYPLVSRITTGGNMLYEETDIVSTIFFNYHKQKGCFCVLVNGDAMEPKLLHGDILLIDPEEKPISGDIILAIVSGRQMIKKLHLTKEGDIELHSVNAAHQTIYTTKEEIQAMYRAVAKQTFEVL